MKKGSHQRAKTVSLLSIETVFLGFPILFFFDSRLSFGSVVGSAIFNFIPVFGVAVLVAKDAIR